MQVRAGERFGAPGTTAEVIVTRAPSVEVALSCAGSEMVPLTDATGAPAAANATGEELQLGKRYADGESGLELLCTKAGAGPLACDGRAMEVVAAKLLPATD